MAEAVLDWKHVVLLTCLLQQALHLNWALSVQDTEGPKNNLQFQNGLDFKSGEHFPSCEGEKLNNFLSVRHGELDPMLAPCMCSNRTSADIRDWGRRGKIYPPSLLEFLNCYNQNKENPNFHPGQFPKITNKAGAVHWAGRGPCLAPLWRFGFQRVCQGVEGENDVFGSCWSSAL